MTADLAVMFQQLAEELNVAHGQIAQLSAAQDTLRVQAASAIAASEARTAALIQQQNTSGFGGGGGKGDWLELVDFKVAKPADFHGKREESWKLLEPLLQDVLKCAQRRLPQSARVGRGLHRPGDQRDVDRRDAVAFARMADTKLYDFLTLQCNGDALVLIEHYDGLGFEAWRQLSRRFMSSSNWT